MIYVCDAIMGTGKTSAAINYMNENPENRYIYITPYLEEANRIVEACPALKFVEPTGRRSGDEHTKLGHTFELVEQGRNIATTHSLFGDYTPDLLDMIREQGYVLFVDENVDVLEEVDFDNDDIQMALDAGYIKREGDSFSIVNTNYHGTAMKDFFKLMRSGELFRMDIQGNGKVVYYAWVLPPELFMAFKDVYVLTYLFEGQSLYYLFKIHNLPYTKRGIHKNDDGSFGFGGIYKPEYLSNLDKMIIVHEGRINEIGNDYHALSHSWFHRNGKSSSDIQLLRNNISNYFNHLTSDLAATERMWATYVDSENKISGRGYTKNFIQFNARATNKLRSRHSLAYAVNIFMPIGEKLFYQSKGMEVDETKYALGIMVQWIFRSAIRDGQKVYIYVPSRRMRQLLKDWIAEVSGSNKR